MQFTTAFVASVLATSANAVTYSGMVYFADAGDCPSATASTPVLNFDYSYDNLCLSVADNSNWDGDGKNYGAIMQAGVTGANNISPKKFGGCPTSKCDKDCTTVEVDGENGNSISADCVQLKDAPYIYIGN